MSEVIKKDPTLVLIQNEIDRLTAQSSGTGLDLNDVKKLEILIKTRQFIMVQPVDVSPTVSDQEISDAEILKALASPAGDKSKTRRKVITSGKKASKT
jgi:hypothetical protein